MDPKQLERLPIHPEAGHPGGSRGPGTVSGKSELKQKRTPKNNRLCD
jgi:hypothetical protein